jgi:acyl dehydratase
MRGVQGHEIVLERLGVGAVYGQMVDQRGRPVPNFTLTVGSANAPGEAVTVTSDSQGFFSAEDVPEGRLRIQSMSFPRFVTSGVTLAAGSEVEVEPVLDIGDAELTGRVVDESGEEVGGARVVASWVQRDGSITHESLRTTLTDQSGAFNFSGLGRGVRDLSVQAPGFEPKRLQGVNPSSLGSAALQVSLTPVQD